MNDHLIGVKVIESTRISPGRSIKSSTMPPAKNRWTVKTLMIVIALTAVILYAGMLIVRSYIWMVRAGW